ncbi:MAG TPA: hypothetical protein VJ716_06720 [Gaiellaceae bacterium]|nr:hypothetical protein [Gaiellaceae bacterium]
MSAARRYLELGLRVGKHADELIDAYWGPEEIAQRVDAEEPRAPAVLAAEAQELLAEVADDPWLAGEVRALWAQARKFAGEELTYAQEGELVYGIEPRWHYEEPFRTAAAMLEEALPGAGDLRARTARWQDETAVPSEILEPALRDVAAELRRLAGEKIGLPEGEDFELELVTNKRWLGYARYLGGLRTQIFVNTDLPILASVLVNLASHEIYGGHHTHHVWQEVDLVRGRDELEWTLVLLWAPSSVISEGVATTGPEIVAGDGQELAAAVLGRLGFEYDAEVGSRVVEAARLLQGVSANVAMLLHDRGASVAEAREYASTWSLQPDDRLDKLVERQVQNPSPVYQHCYWQGHELVAGYVRGDAKRFRELLSARLVPADLGPS